MRLITWLLLVALSLISVSAGRIDLALFLAAVKAVLLGLSFMELKDAARVHAVGYVAFVTVVAGVLAILVSLGAGSS